MRLADFILQNMEAIVARWEAFAATRLPAATNMKSLALRDHAQQILEAIAKDLTTAQTSLEQAEKSMGRAVALSGGRDSRNPSGAMWLQYQSTRSRVPRVARQCA